MPVLLYLCWEDVWSLHCTAILSGTLHFTVQEGVEQQLENKGTSVNSHKWYSSLFCNAVQFRVKQWIAVQCTAIHDYAVCRAEQCSSVQCSVVVQCSEEQCSNIHWGGQKSTFEIQSINS